MLENRKFERKTYNELIHFSMSSLGFMEPKKIYLKGMSIDLSDDGIGIETDYPVERGCVLNFYNGIVNKIGFVKWVENCGDSYKLGAQFV